ncbi:hypothetical protein OOZ19_13845 [Saccharopolyspora sp. NFXS83]|uniref:hypothetical protein n=1 Tax=Saccharopolyspora sp. NFXS83 TaxID=2993560 RepID=UPI00224B1F94|nr:hypothetical protein [Saccharopolyspora sp. NFXS83]MCX2731324.1 hypothetical protein [Saccharopolyspora sp. NFXS83]
MSDSLRRTGGGRGWRLLARTLVVAGAAAAGTSAGWFAGHAGADPAVLDLPGPVLAAPDDSAGERTAEDRPEPSGSSPIQRPVGTVVHHIVEPLTRAAAPDSAGGEEVPDGSADDGGAAEAGPTQSEVDGGSPESADPGRFSLDSLAPQHLVGRVAEAEPVTTVVHGAGSLLEPVRGALVAEPGGERPGPPLGGLTRPVAHGLHQLTSPLWNRPAPEPPATAPQVPVETAPVAEIPPAPQGGPAAQMISHPAPAAATTAAFTADDTDGPVTAAPAAPRQDRPWTPGKAATPPLPAGGATGHAGDGSGGPGGVGLTWPMADASAHLAALRSLDRTAIAAPGSAFAASPGATPD